LVGVGVLVGVAVGGGGVLVRVKVGNMPGGVVVGLCQAGGIVCVGKITAFVVIVGLKSAVIVRSGVGKANGVGEAIKGKLQASEVINNIAMTTKGLCNLLNIIASHEIYFIPDDIYNSIKSNLFFISINVH
jgi:hypothetical protein